MRADNLAIDLTWPFIGWFFASNDQRILQKTGEFIDYNFRQLK